MGVSVGAPLTTAASVLYFTPHGGTLIDEPAKLAVGKTTVSSTNVKTLSAMDVLAPTTMKNAAKCDTSCESQNPVSHQNFERILHFLWKYVCWSVCPYNLMSLFCSQEQGREM
jgi:hypothetical protein